MLMLYPTTGTSPSQLQVFQLELAPVPIYSITPGGVVSASTWYHAALVRDGATMKLYLNGVLIGSCPFLSSTSSGGFISIGHASNGGQKALGISVMSE